MEQESTSTLKNTNAHQTTPDSTRTHQTALDLTRPHQTAPDHTKAHQTTPAFKNYMILILCFKILLLLKKVNIVPPNNERAMKLIKTLF